MAKWPDKDTKRLKEASPTASKSELIEMFPNKSWDAISKKIDREGFEAGWRNYEICADEDIKKEFEKQKTKSLGKAYRKVIKERALQDRLVEAIEGAIVSMPSVKPNKISVPKGRPSEEAAVLLISDSHVGEVVDYDEMLGLGQYDFKTFTLYLEFLTDTVVDIIGKMRHGFNIQDLHIHLLGDIVSGMIHEELLETNEANMFHCTFGTAHVLAQAILELCPHFRHIYVDGVIGNHGRHSKEMKFKQKWNNWDYIVYTALATLLVNQKNVTCNFPYSPFIKKEIYGFSHFLAHGDGVLRQFGIPYYGVRKMTSNITNVYAARGEYVNFFNLGHFHTKATEERFDGETIMNGSWKGGDEYSFARMHLVGEPKQVMYGVHCNAGKSWEYSINFRHADMSKTESRYKYDKKAQIACQAKEIING